MLTTHSEGLLFLAGYHALNVFDFVLLTEISWVSGVLDSCLKKIVLQQHFQWLHNYPYHVYDIITN